MKNLRSIRLALPVLGLAWSTGAAAATDAPVAWWIWPAALFIVAVIGGIRGGVLFVPLTC